MDRETPRPSEAEKLIADYGHAWDIWRELLPGGGHGDWVADRLPGTGEEPQQLRAATVEDLRQALREAADS